jgi:hypothetical protein
MLRAAEVKHDGAGFATTGWAATQLREPAFMSA